MSLLSSSQSGRGDYFGDSGGSGSSSSHRRLSTDMSSLLSHSLHNANAVSSSSGSSSNIDNRNDFSPHFLAAAAAASVQAEAARTSNRPIPPASSSSAVHASSSISPVPPLPYLDQQSPFPLILGNRVVDNAQGIPSSRKGKLREDGEGLSRVRCCWAILSTRTERLDFLYVDPTFDQHLGSEADHIQGTSFFDYIHSEEEQRTRADMKSIIESRTLFGSVTRCRYSTLSQIRSILTAGRSPPEAKEGYLPVDIVVNWVGEDMALCFFHAILDESPQDNDELHKTDWSNWCGMRDLSFDPGECQAIWQSIRSHRTLTPSTTGPQYVFQVLSAVPSQQANASTPSVLFSWPPPRLFTSATSDAITASAINFADGSYFVDDFARLAQGVDQLTLQKELSDANTSCTRRFRAKHTLTTESMIRSVESVLIPYGSIVLACFSVTYAQILTGSSIDMATSRPLESSLGKSGIVDDKDAKRSYGNGSSMPAPPLSSLENSSVSAAQKGQSDFNRTSLKAEEDGVDAEGSVATLAAAAAAASAQGKKCASCGSSHSPEWRKGPDGSKCLCNACGLRYSRNISRARKRDERARIAAEVAANGGIIPPHLRKKPGEEKKKAKRPKVSKKKTEETAASIQAVAVGATTNDIPNMNGNVLSQT